MKKTLTAVLCLALLLCTAAYADTTVRTWTPFGDMDYAAQSYMDLVTAWEDAQGNVVEDYSDAQDEEWETSMREALSAGKADILVLPAGMEVDSSLVLTVEELAELLSDCGVRTMKAFEQADGKTVLTPVRLNWEGLYINTDVLEKNGLQVPETYEKLIENCAVLNAAGTTPISNALAEWSEIAVECAAQAAAPQEQLGSDASMTAALASLSALNAVGAFGTETDDMTAEEQFLSGTAAMRIDGDWLAESVPEDRQDSVKVIVMPSGNGVENPAVPGVPSCGLTIARAALEDPERKEAVLSLAKEILQCGGLVSPAGGTLGESVAALTRNAGECAGTVYDVLGDDTDARLEQLVQAIALK